MLGGEQNGARCCCTQAIAREGYCIAALCYACLQAAAPLMLLWLTCLLSVLQEKVKELHDKFNSELEADRQKFDMLLQEKNEQEVEYEEKLRQVRAA